MVNMNDISASKADGAPRRPRVLLTDHPWEDLDVERGILEPAGLELVAGPQVAGNASEIEAMSRAFDPQAIITCWAPVSAAAIAAPKELKVVARLGVGLDNIAVEFATERGAWVTNVPDYCVEEVSDHAIALLLAHARGIARLDAATKKHGWSSDGGNLQRISELCVGLVGYGRIGRATARKLRGFGCAVMANAPSFRHADDFCRPASLNDIQQLADVIILHAPLSSATRNMIDDAFLEGCRRRPLLINVSRGGLVDNAALLSALERKLLRGAALDVIDGEPTPPQEILSREDVIVTPHVAFASTASVEELRRRACEEVVRVLKGELPQHPCNSPRHGVSLDGGVASDIRIVEAPGGPIVVKQALAKLKVTADWRSDPSRSSVEVAALKAFAGLIGSQSVPRVLWSDESRNTFAMNLIDRRFRNWKKDILSGHVDPATARSAGELLGKAHSESTQRTDLRDRFANTTYFQQLRVEPFFERVAEKLPSLSATIAGVVEGMARRRVALVHGDFSPKNILASGAEIVILDFEVTHWGDPHFDIAFCLSHLLLKAHRVQADAAAVLNLARVFIDGYAASGPEVDSSHLAKLTGCLILARLEGASPVDYRADLKEGLVRALAIEMMTTPKQSVFMHLNTHLEPV